MAVFCDDEMECFLAVFWSGQGTDDEADLKNYAGCHVTSRNQVIPPYDKGSSGERAWERDCNNGCECAKRKNVPRSFLRIPSSTCGLR